MKNNEVTKIEFQVFGQNHTLFTDDLSLKIEAITEELKSYWKTALVQSVSRKIIERKELRENHWNSLKEWNGLINQLEK